MQLGRAGATCAACGRCHASRGLPVERVDADRARRRARSAASATTVHMYSPSAQPKSIRKRSVVLAQDVARGARHRPGTQAADRQRLLRAGRSRRSARRARAPAGRRSPARRSAVVTSSALAARRSGAAEHERARRASRGHHQAPSRRASRVPKRAAGAGPWSSILRRCETSAQRDALASGALAPRRVGDGDVPAVARLEARAGGARLALHRAAGDGAPRRAASGTRARLTSAARSPSGS